jgi:hypothetical protein
MYVHYSVLILPTYECIISDSYDLLTVVGSYYHGHIPYDAIIEMCRLIKPGS